MNKNKTIISLSPKQWCLELAMLEKFEFKPGWSKDIEKKAKEFEPYVKEIQYQMSMYLAIVIGNSSVKTKADIIELIQDEAKYVYEIALDQ